MDVKGVIRVLQCMRSFHLNKFHFVSLNSEVNGCRKPHVWYPKPICLACKTNCSNNEVQICLILKHNETVTILSWSTSLINVSEELKFIRGYLDQRWMCIRSIHDRWWEARQGWEELDLYPRSLVSVSNISKTQNIQSLNFNVLCDKNMSLVG